jgi:ArsR family metal-binding transcriptional regulator
MSHIRMSPKLGAVLPMLTRLYSSTTAVESGNSLGADEIK